MKGDIRNFDPRAFARLDTAMWQAYYQHHFLHLFLLLWEFCYQYTKPNPIRTFRIAYHSAQAAIIFRKTKGNEDLASTLLHLKMFYKLVSDHNTHPFDYIKVARLELEWWMIDRYPDQYNKSRARTLAEAMAATYNVSPQSLAKYGQKREAAMLLLGRHHFDRHYVPDWTKIESLLLEGYQSLHEVVQANS